MPVLASDLLAQRELRLTAVTSPDSWPDVPISWSSTTELEDPVPFLRGGELVLTTALRRRTRDQWDRLVRDLVAVPVAALCVGTGLVHDRVPAGLRAAAERHGLALLTSPVEIPFIQISRWAADQIFAEQYARTRLMIHLQEEITEALLAGRGLRHLVSVLARRLGADVAVLDPAGAVLEQHPRSARWSVDEVAAAADAPRTAAPGLVSFPVRADGTVAGYLVARGPDEQVTLLAPVAGLAGLEIARRQALLSGRRELVGQVVTDILHHGLRGNEAERKLARIGVDPQGSHRVVVASSGQAASLLRQRPLDLAALLRGQSDPYPMCPLDDGIVVLVGADGDARTVAGRLLRHIGGGPGTATAVGVSGPHQGAQGIRIGYHEARQAQRQGPGVQECRTLSLPGLLLSSADLPLTELATALLEPVRRYDAVHGAALEATVRSYLAHDGSATETCRAMNLHRNSLRYRLGQIERLLGKRLTATQDRLELWLALQVLGPAAG